VWRLLVISDGHTPFFDALATWLVRGHRLLVVKGNHDLEWFWPEVRATLRLLLARRIARHSEVGVAGVIREVIAERVHFADHGVTIDGDVYLEHGHRFDKYASVVGPPALRDDELNIPFGSFFNRYLLNRVELAYPFIDNVRPRENLLPVLIRERFSLAFKLIVYHVPFLLRMIPKRYYRYMFERFAVTLLAIAVPLGLVVWLEWPVIQVALGAATAPPGGLRATALSAIRDALLLVLSYVFARVVAYFQLVEPSSLAKEGKAVLAARPQSRVVTFGHTHEPDQVRVGERWFFNTGTWIPIVEASSAAIRHDRTYTYLHLYREAGDVKGALRRWNDDAGRGDPAVVVHRPEER
jgi:hypothetical protein